MNSNLMKGGHALLYANIYDKLLFLVMMCSSAFNVLYTTFMHKKASLHKLIGWTFFIPFGLCFTNFVFLNNVQISMISALSEFCLSASILIVLLHPYNTKNHNLKTAAITLFTITLSAYTINSENLIFSSLPSAFHSIMTAVCITVSVFYINRRNTDKQLMVPLIIWLGGILLSLAEKQIYVREIMIITKICAYIAFIRYFYSIIYNAYMEKINESEKLKEVLEHSLNKEVKKRVFEIERSNERLLEISKTDLLTKAFNKITILNIIEKLINSKKEEIFSILMFDIDNFKIINDSLGHVTGDICLKTLANIASGNIREVDYLGRYGGDEFIIVLPALAENEAKFVAERFKKKVNETSNPKFTVSIGIATYPYDGRTVKDLISAADKGLYKSKSKGKNTISHASLF